MGQDEPKESPPADAGGSRELLRLALPLIVSQSFMTVQVFLDAVLLARHDPAEVAASFPAVMWFWQAFGLLQVTAGYTSTFVAQYTGADRPHRVGPAVWQGVHFAVLAGLAFLLMVPAAPRLIAWAGHPPNIQPLETTYLQCLAFAALPMLVVAAVNGFFSGRGQTWTVLGIEAVGTAVNLGLALVLIFGRLGFPELGIEGAGWATVAGSWASALFAIALLVRPKYQLAFNTVRGLWPERELFVRLLRYGGPAGVQVFLDVFVWNLFTVFVGRMGEAALGATTLAVRLNMVAFLPMMGIGQAVCVLVGQRLGGDRPDLAEKSTYTGLRWVFGYMCVIATAYLLVPGVLVGLFESTKEVDKFEAVKAIVPNLLICVAIFSLADAVNVAFAFALRGAGDTRFVTAVTFLLAWPILIVPTYVVVHTGASLYWAWAFATAHLIAMSVVFGLRFRSGRWKGMRVIEPQIV